MDVKEEISEREALPPCKLGHSRRFLDIHSGQCLKCREINESRGRQKPKDKSDWRPKHQHDAEFQLELDGRVNPAKFREFLDAVMDDPIRFAAFMAEGRRPGNVGKAAHGIVMRKASREPMLNADPRRVQKALERPEKNRLPKMPPFKRIIVKPTNHTTGAKGWYDRVWTIHQLRYSRGVVAVTDDGSETMVFPQYSELRKAILGSGWNIINEDVKQGGNRRG